MIRINLLPHREFARDSRKKAFINLAGLTAILALTTALAVSLGIDRLIEAQSSRNTFISHENEKLDSQIKEIGKLRQEIEALMARQGAVEALQRDRTIPVRVFDELARRTPAGMVLRQIRQDDRGITLNGWAHSNGQVSMLLRTLALESEWMERPELIEIKAAQMPNPAATTARKAEREQLRVFEFTMTAQIKPLARPEPGAKPAGPGGKPMAGAEQAPAVPPMAANSARP
jgi:type IV pilus assembly protein PilN